MLYLFCRFIIFSTAIICWINLFIAESITILHPQRIIGKIIILFVVSVNTTLMTFISWAFFNKIDKKLFYEKIQIIIECIRFVFYNINRGINNLSTWFEIIWNDRNDDSMYLLIVIKFKLKQMLNFFKTESVSADSQEYIKDYFNGNIKSFINWMMNENNKNEKIFNSIKTYIYAIEVLELIDSGIIIDIDQQLTQLNKEMFDKFGEKQTELVEINDKSYIKLKGNFETGDNVEKLNQLRKKITDRLYLLYLKTLEIIGQMFLKRIVTKWWD